MSRYQNGYVFEANGAFHIRYYITTPEGVRKQKSSRLCDKDDKHFSTTCKGVKQLAADKMKEVNAAVPQPANTPINIVDFWEQRYLPHCEQIVQLTGQPRKKPSTIHGYKQIWKQHLKCHFGNLTVQEYTPHLGNRFLRGLTSTQGRNTLKHIKALGTAIFSYAVEEEIIAVNPWHEVRVPKDAIESDGTQHYTLAEAEAIISALFEHVDCQLIVALACFQGLRPSEITGLRWEDFDSDFSYVHIRRSVVRGIVGTPKTKESIASIPVVYQVQIPLALWHEKCGKPSEGWVLKSSGVLSADRINAPEMQQFAGGPSPIDLHNVTARIIRPILEAKKIVWKEGGLYCGRRGACTAAVEATNGNYHFAQALLRHKNMTTTVNVYKKQITPEAFEACVKQYEAGIAKVRPKKIKPAKSVKALTAAKASAKAAD
jgi:integrase